MTVSALRMARLIDDLSDYTVLQVSGELPLVLRPTSVNEICGDVLAEVRAGHPDRVIVEDGEGDNVARWDPDRVAQVLVNLLENALHHGARSAPVTLRWRATAWPPAQGTLFEVRNSGPPIDPAELPHLFEPFRRRRRDAGCDAGDSGPRYHLGLGLFVVQEIVRAHGGQVTVQSEPEQGTRFRVLLPWRMP